MNMGVPIARSICPSPMVRSPLGDTKVREFATDLGLALSATARAVTSARQQLLRVA